MRKRETGHARNISQIYSEAPTTASGEKINANQVSIFVVLSQVDDGSVNYQIYSRWRELH